MKTNTYRDPKHPWNHFKSMEDAFKKILTGMSNENLDKHWELIPPDDRLEVVPTWDNNSRKEKIHILMLHWERNYREQFEAINGFPLDETQDPKKFKAHFKRFRRQVKWRLFLGRIVIFFEWINPFKKRQPKQAEVITFPKG